MIAIIKRLYTVDELKDQRPTMRVTRISEGTYKFEGLNELEEGKAVKVRIVDGVPEVEVVEELKEKGDE